MENTPANAVNTSYIDSNSFYAPEISEDYTPITFFIFIIILIGCIIYKATLNALSDTRTVEGFEIFGIDIIAAIIDPIYEGLGIKAIVDGITNLIRNVKNIFDMIACPFRIIKNIDKCVKYWAIDLLLYIIWIIVWAFLFITLYIPAVIATKILVTVGVDCEFIKAAGFPDSACGTLMPNDILPSKQTVGRYLEEGIYYVRGKHFFYRDDDDINKCYCIPGILIACNPLRVTGIGGSNSSSTSDKNRLALLWAIGIIILMAVGNASKGSRGVPAIADSNVRQNQLFDTLGNLSNNLPMNVNTNPFTNVIRNASKSNGMNISDMPDISDISAF